MCSMSAFLRSERLSPALRMMVVRRQSWGSARARRGHGSACLELLFLPPSPFQHMHFVSMHAVFARHNAASLSHALLQRCPSLRVELPPTPISDLHAPASALAPPAQPLSPCTAKGALSAMESCSKGQSYESSAQAGVMAARWRDCMRQASVRCRPLGPPADRIAAGHQDMAGRYVEERDVEGCVRVSKACERAKRDEGSGGQERRSAEGCARS